MIYQESEHYPNGKPPLAASLTLRVMNDKLSFNESPATDQPKLRWNFALQTSASRGGQTRHSMPAEWRSV
jgi:hypothetical protein